MFYDIQALLDMLQRSRNSHISILFFNTRDKRGLQFFWISSTIQTIYL